MMLLVANQLKIKMLAVVVALALVMPMVMMPVGVAQAQENCLRAGIEYLDAEIKVINVEIKVVDEQIESQWRFRLPRSWRNRDGEDPLFPIFPEGPGVAKYKQDCIITK